MCPKYKRRLPKSMRLIMVAQIQNTVRCVTAETMEDVDGNKLCFACYEEDKTTGLTMQCKRLHVLSNEPTFMLQCTKCQASLVKTEQPYYECDKCNDQMIEELESLLPIKEYEELTNPIIFLAHNEED